MNVRFSHPKATLPVTTKLAKARIESPPAVTSPAPSVDRVDIDISEKAENAELLSKAKQGAIAGGVLGTIGGAIAGFVGGAVGAIVGLAAAPVGAALGFAAGGAAGFSLAVKGRHGSLALLGGFLAGALGATVGGTAGFYGGAALGAVGGATGGVIGGLTGALSAGGTGAMLGAALRPAVDVVSNPEKYPHMTKKIEEEAAKDEAKRLGQNSL